MNQEEYVNKQMKHKPTNRIIRYSDFVAPKACEKQQYKDIPYIDISHDVTVSSLTADITDTSDPNNLYYPRYAFERRVYIDGKAWEIRTGSDIYYLVLFDRGDPSGGLFGAFGSWTAYQIVLFDNNKEPISQHTEMKNADHVRITQCKTKESMIRHLTVWGMVDSTYSEEISNLNEELRNCYQQLIGLNGRIADIYCQREAITDSRKINIYDIGSNTYEEFLDRNNDLK